MIVRRNIPFYLTQHQRIKQLRERLKKNNTFHTITLAQTVMYYIDLGQQFEKHQQERNTNAEQPNTNPKS
jgi:hypothetical protein